VAALSGRVVSAAVIRPAASRVMFDPLVLPA